MCRIFGEKASASHGFPTSCVHGPLLDMNSSTLFAGQHVDRQQVGYDLVFRLGKAMWGCLGSLKSFLFLKHDSTSYLRIQSVAFFSKFCCPTVVERESADGGGNCNLAQTCRFFTIIFSDDVEPRYGERPIASITLTFKKLSGPQEK